jgi:hypothetical protein
MMVAAETISVIAVDRFNQFLERDLRYELEKS